MSRKLSVSLAILLLIELLYIYISFQRVVVPGQIFNELASTFSLNASRITCIGSMFMLAYAFTQILAGMLIQKYGGLRVLLCMSVLLTIGGIFFPLAQSYPMLVISRMLVGISCSFVYPVLTYELNRAYPSKFTSLLGTCCLFGYIGSSLGTVPFVWTVHQIGWRMAMLIPAIIATIVIVLLFFFRFKTTLPPVSPQKIRFSGYWENLHNRNNLLLLFSYTTNYGVYFTVLSVFGKKFLEDSCKLSPTLSSLVSMLLLIVPALYNQVSGSLSTQMGNKRRIFLRMMGCIQLFSCVMLLVGLLVGDFPGRGLYFAVGMVIMSLVAGLTPIASSASREYSPAGALPILIGLINFFAYAMVSFFSSISGWVMNLVGGTTMADGSVVYSSNAYIAIFSIFLFVAVGTFIMAFKLPETNGKNIYQGKVKKTFLGIKIRY